MNPLAPVPDDLAEQLVALLEIGPSSTATLAMEVHRRRATVLAALHGDDRCVRVGSRRGARWHLRPTGWTAADFAQRARISLAEAELFLGGPEGYLERGVVRSTGPGHFELTSRGHELAVDIEEARLEQAGVPEAA